MQTGLKEAQRAVHTPAQKDEEQPHPRHCCWYSQTLTPLVSVCCNQGRAEARVPRVPVPVPVGAQVAGRGEREVGLMGAPLEPHQQRVMHCARCWLAAL